MATVQRYVNTGSTAGGDGTTNATSGSTRAYASLSEWESNAGGSATDDYVVDCCGSTADTAGAVTVNFATDITTGSVLIRGNRGEADGFYDGDQVISTSHYRLAPGNVTAALNVQETKTTVDGIQVSAGNTGSFGIAISIGAAIVTVRKCRVRDANSTDYGIGRAGSAYSVGASTWTIENNLVVGFDTHQINTQYNTAYGATHTIQHNTCYGGTAGIAYWRGSTSCTVTIKGNAIASTSGSDISGTGTGGTVTFDANATDDYDLGTTGEIDLGSTTDAWTSPGTAESSDFTVKDSSSALDVTVSGSLVSDDIRDVSRSNYSVGAFEFVSGSGAVSHEFTTPSFGFTPRTLAPALSTTLSAPAFSFVARALSPVLSNTLTAPAFSFVARALQVGASVAYELGSAAFNFTANAFTWYADLIHELTTASFRFVGRALQYTTGVASAVASLLTYFRRRGRR